MALATYNLTAGTATFGLALPQGAATSGVQVGALNTQTDIKTTWGDGSIRFCIVSCVAPSTGNYDITAGPATSGSFAPTWPTASVAFNIGGTTYTATLPSLTTTDPWLVGPHVKEYRSKVVPMNGGTPHVALEVIFDVRSYASGGHRVDICAQNVKDVTNNNSFGYDVTVTINGSTVFTRTAVSQALFTRWRKTFLVGSPTISTFTPDLEPFHLSEMIPRVDPLVTNDVYGALTDPRYDILGFGDMNPGMSAPGGRHELAYYPYWVCRYIAHKHPSQFDYMLKHADLSGSWTGHITKESGASIRLDEWPTFWLDGRAGVGNPDGPNVLRTPGPFLQGQSYMMENAHLLQLTYVAYMVTGDRYYVDQQKFWGHFSLLWTWPGDGQRNAGPGLNLAQNGTRGFGWPLRVIAECWASLPDGDPDKAYFAQAVTNNLAWLDSQVVDEPGGPLLVPFTHNHYAPDGYIGPPLWQVSYVLYAVNRCFQLGLTTTTGAAWLPYACMFQVLLFHSEPAFPREYACPSYPRVGTHSSGVVTEWFDISEIFNVNYDPEPAQPIVGYYGPETLYILRVAIAQGIAGAQEAYDWLAAYPGALGDMRSRSGFAIVSVADQVGGGEPEPPPATIRRIRWRFKE